MALLPLSSLTSQQDIAIRGRHYFTNTGNFGNQAEFKQLHKTIKSYTKPQWPHFKMKLHRSRSLQNPPSDSWVKWSPDITYGGIPFDGLLPLKWPDKSTKYTWGAGSISPTHTIFQGRSS